MNVIILYLQLYNVPPMSSNIKETTSGTQSPPLEATGSEKPMGVCSIDGTKPTYALDREQRKGDSSVSNFSCPSLLTQCTEYFSHLVRDTKEVV